MVYGAPSGEAEKLVETTMESCRAIIDRAVAVQEQNMKFALGLFEHYRKQQEALQALVEESAGAYMGVLFAPLSSLRERPLAAAPGSAGNGSPPLENYDELTVEEISKQLDDLSGQEVGAIRSYEARHKKRETLLERLDRALV